MKYRAGMVSGWTGGGPAEAAARAAVADFDGWLEHLDVDQVEEIVKDVAAALTRYRDGAAVRRVTWTRWWP